MFRITQKEAQGLEFLELRNPNYTAKAILCLSQGGRVSDLQFNDISILADDPTSTYETTYASSILFPFANRIKDGKYTYDGFDYCLNCNEAAKKNALHGLVYDKTFEFVDSKMTSNYASITLQYQHDQPSQGFPFKFDMLLTYTLTENNFSLSVEIFNKDDSSFPFSLGWHPYFASKNLNESAIQFESDTKYICDKQQIISGSVPLDVEMPYQLKDVKLDDGYKLKSNTVDFITPEYHLNIKSSAPENYLQLYTPNTPNVIAIEPMTGATDSFNNKIGLQTLSPHKNYNIKWTIAFKKTDASTRN